MNVDTVDTLTAADVRELIARLRGALGRVPAAERRTYAAAVVARVDADLALTVHLLELLAGVLESSDSVLIAVDGEPVH